jgi:glycine cleavage system H lipoate-binding protein
VPVPQIDPSAFAGPARGVAADEHLWVETGLGGVVLGLTPAFADLLAADGGRLTVAGAGTRVAAGDRLGTLEGAHGALAVWAPVAGVVNAVNPRLEQDPGLLRRDPEGAGWLLRLVPTAWEHEAPALGWGPRDVALYRGGLERAADPFLDLRVGTLRAMPSPTGWQDVLGALRAERTRPRWPDATALAAELEAPILRALADPAVAGAVGRLGARVVWRVSEPDAALVLDLRPGAVRATLDADAAGPADLTLRSDATTLARWLTGDLDPAGALRRGDVVADRPPGATLRALAVLKHLRIGRLPVRASWHAPCENADGPLS